MAIVSATATRRAVFAMIPTGLAAVAASDMTLRILAAALRRAGMAIAAANRYRGTCACRQSACDRRWFLHGRTEATREFNSRSRAGMDERDDGPKKFGSEITQCAT